MIYACFNRSNVFELKELFKFDQAQLIVCTVFLEYINSCVFGCSLLCFVWNDPANIYVSIIHTHYTYCTMYMYINNYAYLIKINL